MVIRLNLDGTSDTTFDADGRVTTNIETSDSLAEVKLQTDGKIVAAGNAAGSAKSVVIRYNTNGSLDTTFSGDGIALNDFSVEGEPTSSLAIDSISGSIITVGSNFLGQDTSLIIRYILNGTLDTSFSGDGRLEPVLNSSAGGEDVVIQSDRKIIILSNLGAGTVIDDISLIRLNTNGDFDTTFGNDGFVFTDIDGGNIQKLALVGDKLLVVNNANSFQDFGLERYNLSKTPSQTGDFDGDGFTDSTVYRPSTATWFTLRSADNTVTQEQFGLNGDIPMDGDFDGDGRADLAIFRPSSGIWFFKRSSNGTTLGAQFGATGDKPQAGDFDKDGKSDIGLWRPSNGNWFVLRSSSNFTNFFGYAFGANGDIPVQTGAQ